MIEFVNLGRDPRTGEASLHSRWLPESPSRGRESPAFESVPSRKEKLLIVVRLWETQAPSVQMAIRKCLSTGRGLRCNKGLGPMRRWRST